MLQPYYNFNKHLEAGVDEAGCGCLAGPVFAAAVILPFDFHDERIRDSKKLSEKSRNLLADVVKAESLAFAVEMVQPEEIDKINILNARIKAMHMALERLHIKPEYIIVDGDRFHNYRDIPHTCIIDGDNLYYSIAAASIIAKQARDAYMLKIHQIYPQYGWDKNKGYGTAKHLEAIRQFGITNYHRKSYAPVADCPMCQAITSTFK
jgi:ribonuclease HII